MGSEMCIRDSLLYTLLGSVPSGSAGIDGIEYVPLPGPIPGGPSYPPIGSGSGSSRVDSMASYTGEPVGVEVPGYGRDAERGDRDVEPDG